MKLIAFSIFDEKATVFSPPFFLPAVGLATRLFSDLANDKTKTIGKHPSDYKLYQIGHYDDQTAQTDNETLPIFIGNANDYIDHSSWEPNRIREAASD